MPIQDSVDTRPVFPDSEGGSEVNGPELLCIGYDAQVLEERCNYLGRSGFKVRAARTSGEASSMLRRRAFDAVIIGHAVPEPDRLIYIEAARQKNPEAIIVLLYWDSIRSAEKADAILCVGSGPQALVQALRELIDN